MGWGGGRGETSGKLLFPGVPFKMILRVEGGECQNLPNLHYVIFEGVGVGGAADFL